MGCGGHLHQGKARTPELVVSKGDAEHRSARSHQGDKMADVNLGYETEWHSMSVQLVSEDLNFLPSLLTTTLSCKLLLCRRNNKVFHRRCAQRPARKLRKCQTGKTRRSRRVFNGCPLVPVLGFYREGLGGKSHKTRLPEGMTRHVRRGARLLKKEPFGWRRAVTHHEQGRRKYRPW